MTISFIIGCGLAVEVSLSRGERVEIDIPVDRSQFREIHSLTSLACVELWERREMRFEKHVGA